MTPTPSSQPTLYSTSVDSYIVDLDSGTVADFTAFVDPNDPDVDFIRAYLDGAYDDTTD